MLWQRLAQSLADSGLPAAAARALRARLYAVAPLDPDARAMITVMTIAADAAAREQVEKTFALLQDLESRGELPPRQDGQPDPPLVGMLYEASQIYSIVGDEDGADRLLRELLQRKGDHAMALNNLGYLRLESPRAAEDREQITAWIELAYALDPTDSNILDTLGWLRYKQGRLAAPPAAEADVPESPEPGAVELIRSAIDRSDDPSAELFDHLGDVLFRLGLEDEAVESWRRARRMLEDAEQREQMLQQYLLIQSRLWRLVVADPEQLWQRDYGTILDRVRGKLEAIEAGRQPEVAGQFE
jgi:tetratricopeptide (TPR) repeat protein